MSERERERERESVVLCNMGSQLGEPTSCEDAAGEDWKRRFQHRKEHP